ncbi:protein of unknown function [Candidatus Methylopumilus turicensis]|uniref:Uncharacterized protein n=1 Tax=Candidatus Methylopumilus turicensis TaxID=1581680 RepID=A0A0B7IW70_9PROT|nr:protein of unknown function [Candidatus Methylopumilus turicensis]
MNQLNFFKLAQYFMVVAFTLEIYAAVISREEFKSFLFSAYSILSLVTFFLLKRKINSLKFKSNI